MCKHIFCMQACFCRWAVIFATVHYLKGFTGSLYLQDLLARIKIAFLQQSHIAPTIHFNSWDELWQRYIQTLSKQKANSPSSPCSCPLQEVKSKSQTFMSAWATDFLRLLVSLWPAARGLFQSSPTLVLSLGWFTHKQHTRLPRTIYNYREHRTLMPRFITSYHVKMLGEVLVPLVVFLWVPDIFPPPCQQQ